MYGNTYLYIGCELLPGLVDSLFCIYEYSHRGFVSESEEQSCRSEIRQFSGRGGHSRTEKRLYHLEMQVRLWKNSRDRVEISEKRMDDNVW